MTRYKTITKGDYESNEQFDNRLNELTSEGWLLVSDFKTSTNNNGSFLGHSSYNIITVMLQREFSDEEIEFEQSLKKHKYENKSKIDNTIDKYIKIVVLSFLVYMAFIMLAKLFDVEL